MYLNMFNNSDVIVCTVLQVWNVSEARKVQVAHRITGTDDWINCIVISPDGQDIVTLCGDRVDVSERRNSSINLVHKTPDINPFCVSTSLSVCLSFLLSPVVED